MWHMSSLPTVTPSTSTYAAVADNNNDDDDDDDVIILVELNITALHAAV